MAKTSSQVSTSPYGNLDLSFELHPRQGDALISTATEILYGGAAGGGKMLPLREIVPTPSGWSKIGDLREGDYVFSEHGTPIKIIQTHPINLTPKSFELTFDNGHKIRCCEDHLWATFTASDLAALTRRDPNWRQRRRMKRAKRGKGKRPDLALRNSITASNFRLPPPTASVRTTLDIFKTLKTAPGRSNHAIKVNNALNLPPIELPLDPYCLGAWLGDGSTGSGGLTGIDPEVWEQFELCGFVVTHSKTKPKAHYIRGLNPFLRAAGVLHNKHIPAQYLRASYEQRMGLLQGLMDTDGTCDKDGSVEFTNTNKNLADGVFELATSLGWKASLQTRRATLYGKDHGEVYDIKFSPDISVFRIQRKTKRVRLDRKRQNRFHYIVDCQPIDPEPMRCITVDNPTGLFLCSKHMIPTHNSHLSRILAVLWALEIPGIQIYFFRRLYDDLLKNHIHGPTGFVAMLHPWINSKHPKSPLVGGKLCDVVEGEIRFWNGSKIFLCHLQHQKDLTKYYGPEFHVLFIEEATQFSEFMIRFLRSRLRIPDALKIPDKYLKPRHLWASPDQPSYLFPRAVYTSNPGGVGHVYLKRCFLDGFKPLEYHKAPATDGSHIRQFIPAKVDDNPSVNREEVKEGLAGLPPILVDALLNGNWNAVIGAYFPEADPDQHLIDPFQLPTHWTRIMSMDWGACGDGDPFAIIWWAVSDGSAPLYPRGSMIAYRSYYGRGLPKMLASQVAEEIIKREAKDPPISLRVAGGDIWNKWGTGPSIQEIFGQYGVNISRADTRRQFGWMQIRERLVGKNDIPGIYFFRTMQDEFETIMQLQHDADDPNDCAEGDDHFPDAVRYGVMTRPWATEKPRAAMTIEEKYRDPTINELWELRESQIKARR